MWRAQHFNISFCVFSVKQLVSHITTAFKWKHSWNIFHFEYSICRIYWDVHYQYIHTVTANTNRSLEFCSKQSDDWKVRLKQLNCCCSCCCFCCCIYVVHKIILPWERITCLYWLNLVIAFGKQKWQVQIMRCCCCCRIFCQVAIHLHNFVYMCTSFIFTPCGISIFAVETMYWNEI